MIERLLELAWSFGPEVAGLGVLTYLAIWIRRLSAVATYVRVAVLVGALTLLGAIAGVVRIGRALELAAAGWDVLADVLALAAVGAGL